MKSVLLSVQPRWCELIANGDKTVEVRKTKPKIETSFKCYIYCTSSNVHECLMLNENGAKLIHSINYKTAIPCGGHIGNGKVIGEFICDTISEYMPYKWREGGFEGLNYMYNPTLCYESRLSQSEVIKYANRGKVYGWHIKDLVIYDKPKELSEFYQRCYSGCENCKYQSWDYDLGGGKDIICIVSNKKPIKRPPQSWCYVERKENESEKVHKS